MDFTSSRARSSFSIRGYVDYEWHQRLTDEGVFFVTRLRHDAHYQEIEKKTQGTHLKLIVDTSGESLKKLKGSGLFLLKPNLREFREFTGLELLSEEDQKRAGRELVDNGTCKVLVLSLGAEGVLLVTHEYQVRFHSPKVLSKAVLGQVTAL